MERVPRGGELKVQLRAGLATAIGAVMGRAHADPAAPAATAFAGLFVVLAAWAGFSSAEWELSPASARHTVRLAGRTVRTRVFTAPMLRIDESVDGDGDLHATLRVEGAEGRARLFQAMNQPRSVRQLGLQLSVASGLALKGDAGP